MQFAIPDAVLVLLVGIVLTTIAAAVIATIVVRGQWAIDRHAEVGLALILLAVGIAFLVTPVAWFVYSTVGVIASSTTAASAALGASGMIAVAFILVFDSHLEKTAAAQASS